MNTTQLGGTIILSYDRIRSHDRSSLWRLPKLHCYISPPANATRTNSFFIIFLGHRAVHPLVHLPFCLLFHDARGLRVSGMSGAVWAPVFDTRGTVCALFISKIRTPLSPFSRR